MHLVLLKEAKKMEVNNEIDSDNEIKTLLLKILKKLSNKSYKKVEATHEDLNVTHSESDSKLKPPNILEEANIFCTNEEYLCDTCDIVFKESEEYLSHFLQYHGQKPDKITYDCAKCYKSFSKHQLFMEHVKKTDTVHEGNKSESFSKSFSYVGNSNQHTQTAHDNQRDSCDKSFTESGSLKKHVNTIHEGQRNYNSASCRKSFTQSGSLKNHIKTIHEAQKNYAH